MSIVPDAETSTPERTADAAAESPPLDPAAAEFIARMKARTPEEIAAARERIFAASPPPRPLPPGKNWVDEVVGKWPGDETDEEIEELLRKIS